MHYEVCTRNCTHSSDVFISEATPYVRHEGLTNACKYCASDHKLLTPIDSLKRPSRVRVAFGFSVGMGEYLPVLYTHSRFDFRGFDHSKQVGQHIESIAARFAGRPTLPTPIPTLKELAARAVVNHNGRQPEDP